MHHSWGLQSHNVKRRKGGENSNRIWILIPQRPRTFRNEPRERRGLRGAAAKSHTNKPPKQTKNPYRTHYPGEKRGRRWATTSTRRWRKEEQASGVSVCESGLALCAGHCAQAKVHGPGGRRSKPPESACVQGVPCRCQARLQNQPAKAGI